jgi:hypothetical protein
LTVKRLNLAATSILDFGVVLLHKVDDGNRASQGRCRELAQPTATASSAADVDAANPQPSERLFINYAGKTVGVTDGSPGEIRAIQVFLAILGASNYTYIETTWSQQLVDWITSHVRTLEFFGGYAEP